jgi:hypothetical protein
VFSFTYSDAGVDLEVAAGGTAPGAAKGRRKFPSKVSAEPAAPPSICMVSVSMACRPLLYLAAQVVRYQVSISDCMLHAQSAC